MNERRRELLAKLPASAGAADILRCFLQPLHHGIGGSRESLQFARQFLGRCLQGGAGVLPPEARDSIAETLKIFAGRLHETLPDIPVPELVRRFGFATSILVQQLAHGEWDLGLGPDFAPPAELSSLGEIIAFCTPGIMAPVTSVTRSPAS
jgi:hypothetical protein